MRAFKVFIFGLLYGWLLKIAFDRIYRENEFEDVRNENVSLRDYVRSLEMQLPPKSLESKSEQRMTPEMPRAEPRAERQEPPAPAPAQETSEKDDLKVIKGIGPAIEKKLNNAGIYTFAALAQLSPKQLEEILGGQVRRLQDENDLILQAVRLVQNTPGEE